jgi:hypothetical protein
MSTAANRTSAWATLAAALLALHAGSAAAQLYKWTDERGRVTYSNQLPVDAKTADKAKTVEDRVSVYTPDPALTREMAADRRRAAEPAIERPAAPAVAMLGAPGPAPTDAIEPQVFDYPYVVGGGGYRWHRPPPMHKLPQIQLRPGAIAGNMVENGLIPGSTAPLFPSAPAQSRPERFPRDPRTR